MSDKAMRDLLEEAFAFIQGDVETWNHSDPCTKDNGKPCDRCAWLEKVNTLLD